MTEETDDAPASGGPLVYLMGGVYVLAGVMHFVSPRVYEQIIPPRVPQPRELVYLSGVAEVGLGLGVMHPRTREASAYGLVALLLAVFPSNVYMAVGDVELRGVPEWAREAPDWALWARLPLQGVLMLWALRYTDSGGDDDGG